MVDPDIVLYIQTHMGRVPLEDLRRYLTKEGISDLDFEEALRLAREKTAPPLVRRPPPRRSSPFLLAALAAAAVLAGYFAYQRYSRTHAAAVSASWTRKSKKLAEDLGVATAALSFDNDRLAEASYRIEYLSKLDALRKMKFELAAAYNDEASPEQAVDILKGLIVESQRTELVGMTDFSRTASAMIIQASYYKELARSFELLKDADHRQKALLKAETLEKSAEVINSKAKAQEQTQEKDREKSKQKELEDILK